MLQGFYDSLWDKGRTALLARTSEIAPYLLDLSQDRRLGLTLIVRPSKQIAANFLTALGQLREVAPGHYYYSPASFHFTILSFITACETFDLAQTPVGLYREVVGSVLARFPAFQVDFRGLSATPNSIIAQGFPKDDTLEHIRDELREQLRAVGLYEGIDQRYRIQGAHITLGRFLAIDQLTPLATEINRLRELWLGSMWVQQAQLVMNDFYMSADKVRLMANLSVNLAGDAE